MRVFLLLLLASAAHAADTWTGPPVLVTTGTVIIRATPDRAIVRLTTEARDKNAKVAQQEEAKAMTAVRKTLAESHVPDDAVRTLNYELQLEFDYVQGKQTPRGYVARHVVEVRVDDLPALGEIISKAVDSGAAAVSGIQFDVKARDEVERQALRKAVEDARSRAEAAAAGAGTAIAGVIRIEEQREPEPPRPVMMGRAFAAADTAAAPTPIAAGEIEIRATVTLTSALRP